MNKKGNFQKKRQGGTIAVLAVVVILVLAVSYGVMLIMEQSAHSAAEKLVSEAVNHIDEKMNEVKEVTRVASLSAYENIDDREALEQLTRDFVGNNSFVYGSTVAFEPNVFPDWGISFAPYSWRTEDGVVHYRQLGTETNYYEEEWYAQTKLTGEEYWCEPYFDEGGAKVMMCTFSIPLKDSNGKLVAVMTADVGLDDLEEYIESIVPNPNSYIVIQSKQGSTLANTDQSSSTEDNNIIIKGMTEIGWTVELAVPFTYLMRGDVGIFFLIGFVILIAVLFVYFLNRVLNKIQRESSEEYMNVIDALSSSFSSIHLINLSTKETVVFREPDNYSDVVSINENDDFISKISRLIEYECYEADREKMLHEITLEAIRNNLSDQDRYEVRFRVERNGKIFWYEMDEFILERKEDRTPLRAVIAFADVNDSVQKEKDTQDTLEEALEMAESANRAKTTFLNNMSHDIRTPMNAIIGYTNLASSHIDNKEQVQDYLKKIGQSSEHLLSLINDVLDMSRIESGNMNINETEEKLSEIICALYDIVQADLSSKQLEFYLDAEGVEDKRIICDKLRLNQVLLNILSNSIKYTAPGGTITMSVIEKETKEDGFATYEFRIKDNGMGMDKEFLETIFDPFTRVKSSTVSGIQGTGLGMAITKNIVDMMGGTIDIQSEIGEGTEVTIIFNFKLQSESDEVHLETAKTEQDESRFADISGHIFEGKKILLVEDNELNREIAMEILMEDGFVIDIAEDGDVAVEKMRTAKSGEYDLILMDIQMPRMDGYEATRQIRALPPFEEHIPIIAMTANAFDEDRKLAIEAGMDEHIAKPINIEKLKETLAKFLY